MNGYAGGLMDKGDGEKSRLIFKCVDKHDKKKKKDMRDNEVLRNIGR